MGELHVSLEHTRSACGSRGLVRVSCSNSGSVLNTLWYNLEPWILTLSQTECQNPATALLIGVLLDVYLFRRSQSVRPGYIRTTVECFVNTELQGNHDSSKRNGGALRQSWPVTTENKLRAQIKSKQSRNVRCAGQQKGYVFGRREKGRARVAVYATLPLSVVMEGLACGRVHEQQGCAQ